MFGVMTADPIAANFIKLYQELSSGLLRSEVLQMDLSEAPARGRAKRLVIAQCDNEAELAGLIRAWWVADKGGLCRNRCPFGPGELPEDFAVESPMIRFATDGRHVRIGARFGPQWYWRKSGTVTEQGELVASSLVDEYVGVIGRTRRSSQSE